jgi:hypothetical protein
MEKEAGIAEDVAWHEMELLPNLTYTWKGKGATRPVGQAHAQLALLCYAALYSCSVPIGHSDSACSAGRFQHERFILRVASACMRWQRADLPVLVSCWCGVLQASRSLAR